MINLLTENWQIKDIDTVFFDKDGTFLDDNIYWGKLAELRIWSLIDKFNLDNKLFEELCFLIGYNPKTCKLIKNGAIGVLSRNEVIDFVVDNLKRFSVMTDYKTISAIFDDVHEKFLDNIQEYISFIPNSEFFIRKLKESEIKLAVVTSDTISHTKRILQILKIEDCFDCVIGKDSCIETKQSGKPALLALDELSSNPGNTLVIGDAFMDYSMAINAKLKGAILVSTGQTPFEILKEYTKYTVNNLGEVSIINAY